MGYRERVESLAYRWFVLADRSMMRGRVEDAVRQERSGLLLLAELCGI
jgi:hypothetical protein